mmetsp:Transcript_25618/g.60069  ORF Transcript_25618/g.60069 Transcript_25618/m.60069 type:complete len:285 (+) Transcript_25618:1653-2507(+)
MCPLHVRGLLATRESKILQPLPRHFLDVGHDADHLLEVALVDLSEDLLLRLSNTAAGTIAAHEDIEGLEIGSERNRVAAGSLLITCELDFPPWLLSSWIQNNLGILVRHSHAEVNAQKQGILEQEQLKFVDANRGCIRLSENRVAHLGRHEIPAIQPVQVVSQEVEDMRPVDSIGEPKLMQLPTFVPYLAPLFEDGYVVTSQLELDGQAQSNWPTTHDEDRLRLNVGVWIRQAEVRRLSLAVGGSSPFELVKTPPDARPLPMAAVAHNSIELLIGESCVDAVIR